MVTPPRGVFSRTTSEARERGERVSEGSRPSANKPTEHAVDAQTARTAGHRPTPTAATDGRTSRPGDPNQPEPTPTNPHTRPAIPGNRDLPWKATAERRNLWGPVDRPLEGEVHEPHSTALTRPRDRRANPLVSVGIPVITGGIAALGVVALGLMGLIAVPLAVIGGAGAGVLTAGGAGGLIHLIRRPRQSDRALPATTADSPDGTREMLERILSACAGLDGRIRTLRRSASEPTAIIVLQDASALITRIEALAGSPEIAALRPSSSEVILLDGVACRYLPELLDAAERTIGYLTTFQGQARADALENLQDVDRQLEVLADGIERIEQDLVSGVSRSLEVHAEFLRTRFADQHLNPIIDV